MSSGFQLRPDTKEEILSERAEGMKLRSRAPAIFKVIFRIHHLLIKVYLSNAFGIPYASKTQKVTEE